MGSPRQAGQLEHECPLVAKMDTFEFVSLPKGWLRLPDQDLLFFQIEIATMMPSGNRELLTPPPQPEEAEEEEEESTPRLIDGSSPQEPEFPRVLGPQTSEGQVHQCWIVIKSTWSALMTTKLQVHKDHTWPKEKVLQKTRFEARDTLLFCIQS